MTVRYMTITLASLLAAGSARSQEIEPELVAPTIVSTEANETFPVIDPVTGWLWFSRYEDDFDNQTIMFARPEGASWSLPETAPFSGTWGDRAPRFSPDGSRLFFTSNRPVTASTRADLNIWMVTRGSNGSWGDPELVESPVSTAASDMHNVLTDGAMYLASNRADAAGRADVYRIPLETDGFGAPEHLDPPINDALSQPDLYVSPDESWMILVVTGRPGGLGGDDLWISRYVEGKWSELEHLPEPINSFEYEYGPTLSPDGKWLYFTSHRSGVGDIYRVRLPETLEAK